jgi:CRP-like cAMP-binding protein
VPAGEAVVSQWDTSRDFYVIEQGIVDVVFDDELVATLRPGDFFGEIAALEWGARFARSRIATVVARRNARFRVLEPAALEQLLDEFPRLESEIRHTAHRRMRETL